MNTTVKKHLKQNGALWLNLNIAQAVVHRLIQQAANEAGLNLNPIEIYIIAALLEKDGIFASALANRVGRAATSFTPILDKLQAKKFIERKSDAEGDRRAINIHLTDFGRGCAALVSDVLAKADAEILRQTGLTAAEWETYNKVVAALQTISE